MNQSYARISQSLFTAASDKLLIVELISCQMCVRLDLGDREIELFDSLVRSCQLVNFAEGHRGKNSKH